MSHRALALLFSLLFALPAQAGIEQISNRDAISGLKTALEKGARVAVDQLGKTDGFLANELVKIALPESLQQAEKVMRRFGMGKYADELVVTLNRAAEAAVPEAKNLLVGAVKKMSVNDAKGILTGGETAGTEYFRSATSDQLRARFLPIVKRATAKVGLAQKYNEYAGRGAKFGLIDEKDANLDTYVTEKALDGLFKMIAEEEKRIRKDPVGTASNILKKVFGALKL